MTGQNLTECIGGAGRSPNSLLAFDLASKARGSSGDADCDFRRPSGGIAEGDDGHGQILENRPCQLKTVTYVRELICNLCG
ncbi:hypothetical protein CQW32_04235 [Pseudomonas putida]|nr:hypothetical protein CQW32_04235 [Pseudomonas putida]